MSTIPVLTDDLKQCFRCGYDLLGIADEQPCPECGLLAARSRRETDALHLARPRWLRRLSLGIWLILLAIVWPLVWLNTLAPFYSSVARSSRWRATWNSRYIAQHVAFRPGVTAISVTPPLWEQVVGYLLSHFEAPLVIATTLLILGAMCLASPEGFEPADRADKRRRRALVIRSIVPTLALALSVMGTRGLYSQLPVVYLPGWLPMAIATAGCLPLPILLFFQLRSLAKRARSAQLAEHCAIVGIGVSASLAYAGGLLFVIDNARELGLSENWLGSV